MPITFLLAAMLHLGGADADTTIRLTRGTAIEISTYQGAVTVHTGSDDQLRVRGGRVRGRGGSLQVEGDDPSRPRGGDLDITAPAWVRLDVSSYNGALTFDGPVDRLDAETVNGEITVRNGGGTMSLSSVNGAITVNGFRGEKLSIDATGGDVLVTGGSGRFSVESVNGAVRLREMRATALQASSINDVVEYSGTFDPKGSYDLESHNGGINLWLPTDVSARMRVSTFNGEFTSPDIPATTNGTRDAARPDLGKAKGAKGGKGSKDSDPGVQEFIVTFGRGDAAVSLDSFNGDISVHRLRPRQP